MADIRDIILKEVEILSKKHTDKLLTEIGVEKDKYYAQRHYDLYFDIYTAIKKSLKIK